MSKRGIGVLIVVLAAALWVEVALAGQSATTSPPPRFDAASVKPSAGNSQYGASSIWQFMPNGDVRFENATLHLIIALAYPNDNLRFSDILLLGTQPVLQQRFDIFAKAPAGNDGKTGLRLQALLEERFKLRTHTETREVPVYALTLVRSGRLGRNLKEAKVDCTGFDYSNEATKDLAPACGSYIRRDAVKVRLHESGPMALLARRLHQGFTDRPLVDQTGLDGLFEWDITFAVDRNPAADSEFPSLETALADELGLKLAPQRAPRDVRIIDNAEAPTDN
jgi:uncharacterized protein (TIGR03435 family)